MDYENLAGLVISIALIVYLFITLLIRKGPNA